MSFAIGGITAPFGASKTGAASAPSRSAAMDALWGAAGLGASASTPPDASASGRNSGAASAVSDFLDYAKKTPAERMREGILKSMGLSEEDLKSMSPAQRKAVEDTIRERIKQAAEDAAKKGKTGVVADVTA